MSWDTINDQIDRYVDIASPVAESIRPEIALCNQHLRIFCHPLVSKIAYEAPCELDGLIYDRIADVSPMPWRPLPITGKEVRRDGWIKVAESKPLRAGLEALQFLPSTSGIPNAPSPLAAMIATSLLGAGLGYGTGALFSKMTPEGWDRRKLRRTGAVVGGLAGALPGALWAGVNAANNRSITSPWPNVNDPLPVEGKTAIDTIGLSPQSERQPGPADVNVNSLGQVLWNNQAPAPTTAMAMGTMYAADQFPDPTAPPGYVTGHQLGQMAMAAGKGYVIGKVVGKVLNVATGMPNQRSGQYGAAIGLINFALPKLFS